MKTKYNTPFITVDEIEKTDVLLASKTIEENAYTKSDELFDFELGKTSWGWSDFL